MKNQDYPLYTVHPKVRSLREMLELKARKVPKQVAFRYRKTPKTIVDVTYQQFYSDVVCLGNYLIRHRVTNRKVAIIGENSYPWLVAFFALVTTGNTAVLIAKDAADTEITTMLQQSESDLILYSESCAKSMEHCKKSYGGFRKRFYSMAYLENWISRGRTALGKGKNYYQPFTTDPDRMCAILFTSGSTGFSKGVMLSQTNICSNICACLQFVDPKGPTVAVLPFNHAFGLVTCLLLCFHAGMEIFICSKLSSFMRDVAVEKPRSLALVPLFVETFYKTIWRTAEKEGQTKKLRAGMVAAEAMLKVGVDKRRQLFASVHEKFGGQLECIVCGGAPLDKKMVKEFRTLGVEILNGYGITECSPVLAVNRVGYHQDGSVGHTIPDVELRLEELDHEGNGEIVARGPGVMAGYYGDPQATAQVLDKDGWFHTGDLGHMDKEGFLTITGRKKSLIILANGENVSPEELEQYVSRIDEVNEVVVYEENNSITAEIFPEETGLSPEALIKVIQKKIDSMNAKLPNHKHIQKVKLRATEFEKTATKKIKRFKAAAQAASQAAQQAYHDSKEDSNA